MPTQLFADSEVMDVESKQLAELEQLMSEFPEWRSEFPEIYNSINPKRYDKHKNHLKYNVQPPPTASAYNNSAKNVPTGITHYQETYVPIHARPRSSKRPSPPRPVSNKQPMTFATSHRAEFIQRDTAAAYRAPVKKESQVYSRPTETMETHTHYRQEYVEKRIADPAVRIQVDNTTSGAKSAMSRIRGTNGQFYSDTTTKEHYKVWPASQRPAAFGEPPSFANSLIFPNQDRSMATTNSLVYSGSWGEPATAVKPLDGTLTVDAGSMQMDTTHRATYTGHANFRRSAKHKPAIDPRTGASTGAPLAAVAQREKFASVTQTHADFPGFTGKQLRRRAPAQPAPSTIRITYDDTARFETEQRKQFHGVSEQELKMAHAPSYKKLPEVYKPPTEPLETLTSQKSDYQPLDLSRAFNPPNKTLDRMHVDTSSAKFDDTTTSKVFYKQWKVEPHVRHGDPYAEGEYEPPTGKFEDATTTKLAYHRPSEIEVVKSYKPEQQRLEQVGEHDFNTINRLTYVAPRLAANLTKEQRLQLLEQLQLMKARKLTRTCAKA